MSSKCVTLCALLLLISISATWAEESNVVLPQPKMKEADNFFSQDLDNDDDDLLDQDLQLDGLEPESIAELHRLVDELEADEIFDQSQPRASSRRVVIRRRSGTRRSNKRRGMKRRRGNVRRGNFKRSRNGIKRRTGAKQETRQ